MVGDRPQRHAHPFVVGGDERLAGKLRGLINERPQQVGLVVRANALEDGAEAFQPHARVDRGLRQGPAITRRHLLELHEHQVPDLHPPVTVASRSLAFPASGLDGTGDPFALEVMDLAAGPARAGLAHGPEIVLVAERDDPRVAHVGDLLPQRPSLGVGLVHRIDEALGIDGEGLRQQLVRKGDGVGLEVVAEGEVPQHLEERVMSGGAADVVQVVVLPSCADTLLRRRRPGEGGLGLTREVVLELVHPGVREQQRRVVVGDQRRARELGVSLLAEEVQEGAANLG